MSACFEVCLFNCFFSHHLSSPRVLALPRLVLFYFSLLSREYGEGGGGGGEG